MAFNTLLHLGNTPAVSQTIVLVSGQGARISIYSIKDGVAPPQATRFEIHLIDGDYKIKHGRLRGFDRTKGIEGLGTFTLTRPAYEGPFFGASLEFISLGGYPSKTLVELVATAASWRAAGPSTIAAVTPTATMKSYAVSARNGCQWMKSFSVSFPPKATIAAGACFAVPRLSGSTARPRKSRPKSITR